MEFPFFDPAGAPNQLGYFLTIGFLSRPSIKQFVSEIRAREGIKPPVDEETLEWNLAHHPPEQFEEEAFEHVRDVWFEMVAFLNAHQQASSPFGEQEMQIIRAMGALDDDAAMPRLILDLAQPEQQARRVARAVAEFIVCDLLRIPEPVLPFAIDGVRVVASGEDAVVTATATPFTRLDDLIADFRAKCREVFGSNKRRKLPDLAEKLWFNFARSVYKERGETEGRMDRRLAELSFTINPEKRPAFDVASPDYEEIEEREAVRIRAMLSDLPATVERLRHPRPSQPAPDDPPCET